MTWWTLFILVDDGSRDQTIEIAYKLGLQLFAHNRNYGYGANQKTCYREALRAGADIVVMVHPDYQYDPTLVPEIIRPSRKAVPMSCWDPGILGGNVLRQGTPWWKFISNRILTGLENCVFGLSLSEYTRVTAPTGETCSKPSMPT